MGKGKELSKEENCKCVSRRGGVTASDVAKVIKRDTWMIKKAMSNINCTQKTRSDAGKREIMKRENHLITRALKRNLLGSSKNIFQEAGVARMNRATRNNILNDLAKFINVQSSPPLSKANIRKRISWANAYTKYDFSSVLFTDECQATLNGPDAFTRGLVGRGQCMPNLLQMSARWRRSYVMGGNHQ